MTGQAREEEEQDRIEERDELRESDGEEEKEC